MHDLATSNPILRMFYYDMIKTFFICIGSWLILMFLLLYTSNAAVHHMSIASCIWLSYICWKQLMIILISSFGNGVQLGFECSEDPELAKKLKIVKGEKA